MSYKTKDSGQRAEFENGGVRDSEEGKAKWNLLFPKNVPYADQLLTRVAELMARGAQKYSDRNWEQFSSPEALERAKSSSLRHHIQHHNGETDEDHAAAVVFNLMVEEYVKGVLAGKWEALRDPKAQEEPKPEPRQFSYEGEEPPPDVTKLRLIGGFFHPDSKGGILQRKDWEWAWADDQFDSTFPWPKSGTYVFEEVLDD